MPPKASSSRGGRGGSSSGRGRGRSAKPAKSRSPSRSASRSPSRSPARSAASASAASSKKKKAASRKKSPRASTRSRSFVSAGDPFSSLYSKYDGDFSKYCAELFHVDASSVGRAAARPMDDEESVARAAWRGLMIYLFNQDLNGPDTRALLTAAVPFLEEARLQYEARLLTEFVLPNLDQFNPRKNGSIQEYSASQTKSVGQKYMNAIAK